MTLREAAALDAAPLFDLLSTHDASRFGLDGLLTDFDVQAFIERAVSERAAGKSFTYVITLTATRSIVGALQVRALDPAFEAGEWECTIAPAARGTGVFVEAAQLAGSFAFGSIGVRRLEARVPIQNGRGNGALRKLGAVQEGILRRSIRLRHEYVDQILWSILKDDWGANWASTSPRVH